MSEAVIDALEQIHVANDHAQWLTGAPRERQFLVQPVQDGTAVEQTRQRIMRGALYQVQRDGPALHDVKHAVGKLSGKNADEFVVQIGKGFTAGSR